MYLLDTNVVSEMRKIRAAKADPNVAAWSSSVDLPFLYISAITIQELETGVLMVERRDPVSGAVLRDWLDKRVLEAFDQRILPVDVLIARRAAAFHVPDPKPANDALIAATALVRGMTMVTANSRDFLRFEGVSILNPWQSPM